MWLTWLKTALAGLLAFAAVTGLVAVWHDGPYVYPAILRTPRLTMFVRASRRHVALGGWSTTQNDLLGTEQPYWQGAGLHVYTNAFGRADEHWMTDNNFATARHSGKLGEFGLMLGLRSPPVPSHWELLVPTWLAVGAGVAPLIIVVVGRVRRRQRFLQGHCRVCGYDLRATPGLCPECGTPPKTANKSAALSA
jgi:hypothetical protein